MLTSPSPRQYGIPHDEFRPAQWNAIQRIEALPFNDGFESFAFIEAPTGVGKSAIATAMGRTGNVTVLVGTLNLLDQYKSYGFEVIKGRQNYPCRLEKKRQEWWNESHTVPTAAECHFSNMTKCPAAGQCDYLIQKHKALSARRLAVTYPYAMLSKHISERDGILVCDEGHDAAEQIIGFSGFEIGELKRQKYGLPRFPIAEPYGPEGDGDIIDEFMFKKLLEWFSACRSHLENLTRFEDTSQKTSRAKNLLGQFERIANSLERDREYFLESGTIIRENAGKGRWTTSFGIRLKALTAKSVGKRLWENKSKVVLMSATIGQPEPLADELGIGIGYIWSTYPHPIPIDKRPVFDIGAPRMTHSNISANPNLYKIQAMQIYAWMRENIPDDWRGIALTSSYVKIKELSKHLSAMLTNRRIMTQLPGGKVDQLSERFLKDRQPGDLLVASIQGFGHGLDLKGDIARFAIVAGVPHVNPRDRYENIRKGKPGGGKYAWWKSYLPVPQVAGRVSRGMIDPETGEYYKNIACLADESATTSLALRYYPEWFVKAIR